MFRMDAWVMAKSWSKMCCTGYEIKVARSDFLRDDKWQAYLPFCNAFYFVSPPNVIATSEVPHDAGLMVTSKNTTNLYTKKKAPFRDIQIDADIFRYVLMWRAKITRDHHESGDKAAWWREFIEGRASDKDLGWRAGKRVGEVLRREVDEIREKQMELEKRLGKFAEVRAVLERLGIREDVWLHVPTVEEKLRALSDVIPDGLDRVAKEAIGSLERMLRALDKAREKEGSVVEQAWTKDAGPGTT
jgi:hypothetical protein